jgi:p70 ribosomal S6 kinase
MSRTATPLSPPSLARIGLKDFNLKSVIGKGAYGKVFLVQAKNQDLHAMKYYAMKVLRKASLVFIRY